jgi:hypothetical protein
MGSSFIVCALPVIVDVIKQEKLDGWIMKHEHRK